MSHPSLSQVQWRDLRQLKPTETIYNVLLSLPFLLLSWWSAWQGLWLVALAATFFFFTAALRQAHDCYHCTLGVNKVATELMLFLLSMTMLCSTHAIRHTHLNHHRDPLGESDVEGNWARLPWYKAILGGGLFSMAIQWFGLTHGSRRNRLLVVIDMLLIVTIIATAFITMHPVLIYHVIVMILANTMVGFFAVWSVHHGCDEVVYARSERQPLVNLLTFNLLYHIEHHLFPAVPTNHLPLLAERLDQLAPQWTQQPVVPMMAVMPNTVEKIKTKTSSKFTTFKPINQLKNRSIFMQPIALVMVNNKVASNHQLLKDSDEQQHNDCPIRRSFKRLLTA